MPEFRYKALNGQGHELEGTLSAPDANAAVQQLSRQGLRIKTLAEGAAPVLQQPTAPQALRPAVSSPRVEMASPVNLNKAGQTPRTSTVVPRHTKPAFNNELFFLFSQLANMLKGGIAPSEALQSMATRHANRKFYEPLRDMAHMAGEGGSLAFAMEHYPDLFSPGIVGAVRAGEEGGYLPEACEVVSEQCHETHKLMRIFWWVGLALIYAAFTFALAMAMERSIDLGIDMINGRKSEMNPAWEGLRDSLFGPVGLAFLVFIVVYFLVKKYLRSTSSRRQRHEIAYRTPLVSKRVASEGLALFSWHLSKLGHAGLSPFASWKLAAQAVPNVAFSERLLDLGQNMNEKTKFSQLFYGSRLFPHEISALVETGEMTGSVGGALEQAMDHARNEQKVVDTMLKAKAGCWALLLIFGVGAIAFLLFYGHYLRSAMRILD